MRNLLLILLFPVLAFGQGTPTLRFNTVADMVAKSIPTVNNSLTALVTGRVTANDGGGGTFYFISASVTSTNLGTVFPSTGVAGRWFRQYDGEVDIRWFGAVGDGSADSTPAIQGAVNVAGTSYLPQNPIQVGPTSGTTVGNGAATIFVPDGRFSITSSLSVPSGITIKGNGAASQLFYGASYFGPLIELAYTSPDGNASARRNFKTTIRDITLNGNFVSKSIGLRGIDSFSGKGVYDLLIDNCSIIEFNSVAVWIEAPIKCVVQNSSFENNTGTSLKIIGASDGSAISSVVGCKFYSGGTAIESFFGAVTTFSRNLIENNNFCGFVLHGERGSTLAGNYFESNGTTATNIGYNILFEPSMFDRTYFQTGAASNTLLVDTNANFSTTGTRPMGVKAGDKIRNLATGGLWQVSTVDSTTQLTVSLLTSGVVSNLRTGDPYYIQARTGVVTTGSSTKVTDTGADFIDGVGGQFVGMQIFNTSNGSVWTATAFDSTIQLSVTLVKAGPFGVAAMNLNDTYTVGYPSIANKLFGNSHTGHSGHIAINMSGDSDTHIFGDSCFNLTVSDNILASLGLSKNAVIYNASPNLTVTNNAAATVFSESASVYRLSPMAYNWTAPATMLHVADTNKASGTAFNSYGNVLIHSIDAAAINVGGSLSLAGRYSTSDTNTLVNFARISGVKANGTPDDVSGSLQFYTHNNTTGTGILKWTIGPTGDLIGNSAASKVITTGSGDLQINTAGNGNVGINPDGAGTLTVSASVVLNTAGDGFQIKEGSNARMGVSVLNGGSPGTVTVNNTSVTASTRIFLTVNTTGGTVGFPYVSARTASTSFAITSSANGDTSTVAWLLVEPSP